MSAIYRRGRMCGTDAAVVRETKAKGLGATVIAKTLRIGRASAYRMPEAG